MNSTLTDPTREETEAAAELLSEILRQPNDGYLISVAEDMLRAAARVRLRSSATPTSAYGVEEIQPGVWALAPMSRAVPDILDAALGEGRR